MWAFRDHVSGELDLRALIPFALVFIAAPCLAQSADSGARQQRKRLSYEQVQGFRGRTLFRVTAPSVRWTADRRRIIYGKRGAQRIYDPRTREDRAATSEDLRGTARAGARDGGQGRRRRRGRQRGSRIRIAGAKLAFDSPDKKHVAFVRGYNLWVYDVATKKERQITKDGSAEVYNGELDWVYQEELYGRGNYRGHWWEPKLEEDRVLATRGEGRPDLPDREHRGSGSAPRRGS